MKIVRNFSKTITFLLHLSVLVLAIIAFIFALNKEMFIADQTRYNFYATYTGYSPIYTLTGLIGFSDSYINSSTMNSQVVELINFTEQTISAAKFIKVLIIIIFAIAAILVLSQLFSIRLYSSLASLLLLLISFIILKHYCVDNFIETKLIINFTKNIKSIISLLSVATGISALTLGFDIFIKKTSK